VHSLIFISHATPDDNDFVLWLAGRLAGAGYEVWSDLTKLIGGELFWDRIEAAIRNDSAVFLSVVSRKSIKKRNFLNELSVATAVEVARQVDDFVVPLRVDDLSFGEVPVQLHRKNIIDFFGGWHLGLITLLSKLNALQVPYKENSENTVRQWSGQHFGFLRGLTRETENVATNWLESTHAPASLFVTSLPGGLDVTKLFELSQWPLVKFRDYLVSYVHPRSLPSEAASAREWKEISTDAVISQEARFLKGADAHAGVGIVTNLLRRAWGLYSRTLGLHEYRLARRRQAWFLPLTGSDIAWIDYEGMSGEKRKKRLIGKSETRNVYWHAALEFSPHVRVNKRVALTMHVVFTRDGVTPLGEAAVMHRLRRRFCKNWWQGQWRDLQLAFLAFLSRGDNTIKLTVAPDRFIEFASQPMRLNVPVTHTEVVKDISDRNADELSDEDGGIDDEYIADLAEDTRAH
jgi:hypothetical protein